MPRFADPLITVSDSGRFFFTMLPPHWNEQAKITREPFGVAYELRDDGSLRELWRVKGWYAFKCFLSNDGRYLVAIYDWPGGQKPSREDVAVVFYDRGKRLGQFSTADLVKDASKVEPSVSHYEWFFRPKEIEEEFPGPEAPRNPENTFGLTTVDGISYTFDVTRGAITATKQVVIPPAE
ncbi:MAG TPA: hypothetical protein VGW39_01095 [Chthoniobacterales bacterium]|nr:hypothetical protein [Chthoniobacterales bacterium]